MRPKYIGLVLGMAVAVIWSLLGFWDLVFVLVCGALGYVIGGVLSGDLDLQPFIDMLRRK